MITPDKLQLALKPLYDDYNSVVKLLLADIEARYEEFPPAVFNEIRALHDHIARCYRDDFTTEMIYDNITRAEGHISRIILDCFKYLILSLSDGVKDFEKRYRNVDLSTIGDGEFYINYKRLYRSAVSTVRNAKLQESINKEEAMAKYEEAYNLYTDLEELIYVNRVNLHRAKSKHSVKYILKIVMWFVTAIASGLVSVLLAKVFS